MARERAGRASLSVSEFYGDDDEIQSTNEGMQIDARGMQRRRVYGGREKAHTTSRHGLIHLHRLPAHMLPDQRRRPRVQILGERKRLGHLWFAPRSLVQLAEEEVDVKLVRRAVFEVEEVGFGDLR